MYWSVAQRGGASAASRGSQETERLILLAFLGVIVSEALTSKADFSLDLAY